MKQLASIFISTFLTFAVYSQELTGAWEATIKDKDGILIKNVVIFTEGYQVSTYYEAETGIFKSTNGGKWSIDGNMVTEIVEFDTENTDLVGTSITFEIELSETTLKIVGYNDYKWKRLDNGTPGELNGAWLISGIERNGEMQTLTTNRPRKTMKILSGSRFQWIAYNIATKEFLGTGGGTYTTVNGKYTENIEFFSRDNSRVGASLEFDYDLKNENWHHSGFSSKGSPLNEIWKLRINLPHQ